MNYYYKSIFQSIDFIENNLENPITLSDVIKDTGFSKYHFHRVFKAICGDTVNEYIRRRRLTRASLELLETNNSIIHIALKYGYNSQEAFTRAFKDTYGLTPKVYRKNKKNFINLSKPEISMELLELREEPIKMKPTIIEKNKCYVVGLVCKGKNENDEVSKLWNEFNSRYSEIEDKVLPCSSFGYESYGEDFHTTGDFTYMAGVEVTSVDNIPEGMDYVEIPANKYAVFAIPAIIETLPNAICSIYSKWIPECGLKVNGCYDFEYYDETFKANDATSNIYFCVPVK
jgi:AraC family transcriptional regulator